MNLNLFGPKRRKKTIKLLKPLDYRGENFPVEMETELGYHCKEVAGTKKLFIKWGPSWTFPDGIEAFGVEGTPLTAHPTLDDMEVPISNFLKETWGKDKDGESYYDKLPLELRVPIETDSAFICGIKATLPGENMDLSQIETASILKESHAAQIREYGKSTPKKSLLKDNLPTLVFGILCFFVGMLAQMKGWI